MSTTPFGRILVPIASTDDARATSRALRRQFDLDETDVTFVYVVEKAGGAPDKAGVEQREEVAEEAFEAARAELPDVEVETAIAYDTDVAEGIRAEAAERGVDAIAFLPREESRLARFLSGDVALSLIADADRPVVSLPGVAGPT